MTMPTTETNARAIAASKGYEIIYTELLPERVYAYLAVDPVTRGSYAEADSWAGILRLLMQLPPLGSVQDRIAASQAEIRAELERRGYRVGDEHDDGGLLPQGLRRQLAQPCPCCGARLALRTLSRPDVGEGAAEWRVHCPVCDTDYEREPDDDHDDGPAAA